MGLKFVVGVNVLTSVDAIVYGNHCKFWHQVAKDFPEDTFTLIAPPRFSIDRMRNECALYALKNDCDYIVFIDDDVLIPDHSLRALLETMIVHKASVVAGLTYIRNYPFRPMIFHDVSSGKSTERHLVIAEELKSDAEGLIFCQAVGFSYVLLDVRTLKKVPAPWFITGKENTEDVYYCLKALDYSAEQPIICNMNVQTGHLGDKSVVHHETVEKLREAEKMYYKPGALDHSIRKSDELADRIKELVK